MNKYKNLSDRINARWNGNKCTTGWAMELINTLTVLALKQQMKEGN